LSERNFHIINTEDVINIKSEYGHESHWGSKGRENLLDKAPAPNYCPCVYPNFRVLK
jgi:hypothetical protein